MMVMVFVNELSGVRGLPWWTHHAKADVDAMTYVDMVFPFFLFCVGFSIPLAISGRFRRNPPLAALWIHVAIRTVALMTIGLVLANADRGDASRMILPPALWAIVALIGTALFLNEYGESEHYATLHRWLRIVGVALVVGSSRSITTRRVLDSRPTRALGSIFLILRFSASSAIPIWQLVSFTFPLDAGYGLHSRVSWR
jgi:hypothetical protein